METAAQGTIGRQTHRLQPGEGGRVRGAAWVLIALSGARVRHLVLLLLLLLVLLAEFGVRDPQRGELGGRSVNGRHACHGVLPYFAVPGPSDQWPFDPLVVHLSSCLHPLPSVEAGHVTLRHETEPERGPAHNKAKAMVLDE